MKKKRNVTYLAKLKIQVDFQSRSSILKNRERKGNVNNVSIEEENKKRA
jgi:hypothetical protein